MTAKHHTVSAALSTLRADVASHIDRTMPKLDEALRATAQAHAIVFGSYAEQGIALGYAAGFEAAREQALAECAIICEQRHAEASLTHAILVALTAMEKGAGP